jgi:hypothetical protein
MVKLGKDVKGRGPNNQPARCIIRIRYQDKTIDELSIEQTKMNAKREVLKS